jgi:hypothetical protein
MVCIYQDNNKAEYCLVKKFADKRMSEKTAKNLGIISEDNE